MSEIEWKNPPAAKGGKRDSKWPGIFAALRERPGEWALVHSGSSAAASTQIRLGTLKGAQPGEFDAVSRRSGGGFDIYACYVGEVSR